MRLTYILILLAFFYQQSLFAQLRITGSVTHNDEALASATIRLVEEGRVIKSYRTDRRGRYALDVAFDKKYTLVFNAPYMLPVSIDVDSRVDGDVGDILYEVPLKMVLHYRYAGMDIGLTTQSIGLVSKTGEGEASFSFTPFPEALEKLRPLYDESMKQEQASAVPFDADMYLIDEEVTQFTTEIVVENEVVPGLDEGLRQSVLSDSAGTLEKKLPANKMDKAQERYATIESAKAIEQSRLREVNRKSEESQNEIDETAMNYIDESKKMLGELKEQDQERNASLAEARVAKNNSLQEAVRSNPAVITKTTPARNVVLVRHSVENSMFLFEETIMVEEAGKLYSYRKSVYNWVLFDLSYYTKDDQEISEHEYNEVRKSMGI